MSSFDLELITSAGAYGLSYSVSLPMVSHVHNRVERFIYVNDIKPAAVALDYVENPEMDSRLNLQVANKAWGLAANANRLMATRAEHGKTNALSITSEYAELLITDQLFIDEQGERRPLFYKHTLPSGVTQCKLMVVAEGNRTEVDSGYVVDLNNEIVYTNYQNSFNLDTGAYVLYYLISTTSSGETVHELLNPVPVAKEAGWEDITATGELTNAYPVYTREKGAGGYTFYLNSSGPWYHRPLRRSLIQPLMPSGIDTEDPWYIRFSHGDVSGVANGSVRRYYIPEFDTQPFSPSKPYIYSSYIALDRVNDAVISVPRENLAIDPDNGRHLTLFVSNYENVLQRVFTTNQALHGKRYSNTSVYYEADKIQSYDNAGGFISLGVKVLPGWELIGQMHYEADDFEYTAVNFNPVMNKQVRDRLVVIYLVPDVNQADTAIHHLVVDTNGVILSTSQSLGIGHPNLQLLNADGSYNSNTVVGMRYSSELPTGTFLDEYAVGYSNDNAYLILAEVSVLARGDIADQIVYDVRRPGLRPVESKTASVLRKNPKILQSAMMNNEQGQEVPKNKVMIIEAPLTLLEDYGGTLTEAGATSMMTKHLDAATLAVIDWYYASSEISGTSFTAGQVDLSWTWEAPDSTYVLYRRPGPEDQWVEIDRQVSPGEATLTYSDTNVQSGETWYYGVRIIQDGIEFPFGNSVVVKVR